MKEEIAYRIRMARLYKGLSQENVAVELGLTTAAYSNIERGITDISVSRLAQISRILEKEISELMGFMKPNTSEGDLVYEKAFGEQIVLLSQQIAQL
jgi:transcriptional regulator with XRE-family HTH domain